MKAKTKLAGLKKEVKTAVIPTKTKVKTITAKALPEVKRYSEKELLQFRKVIVEKLEEAKNDNDLLKSTLSFANDNGTNDTSPNLKMMEDGSEVETKEETAQLSLRQEKFIRNLQNALIRIENKTYGICRVTGQLIPKERLLSVPHTTLCIGAKMEQQFSSAWHIAESQNRI